MRKYFYVQLKRLRRIVLPVVLVAAVLFGCVMAVYDVLSSLSKESEVTTRFKLGVVGTADDFYLNMGMKAMESMDTSRFSIDLVEMTQEKAEDAMRQGKIAAFMVFPDDFLGSAFRGKIIPVKFVCTAGSIGLVSMVKDEFTEMVEIMLIESQRGIYGVGDAMSALGAYDGDVVNDISIEYAEFVFKRGNIYKTSELPAFDGLGMEGYLITGLCIMLFLLICLTFCPIMVRRDNALSRMLCARGLGCAKQVLCDFTVYMLGLLGIAGVLLAYLVFWLKASVSVAMLLTALPALLALGAMSFLMYALAGNLISGVLLQFFASVILCFISGCMYPISFFPETVQKLSALLPTGMARQQIANCILQTHDIANTAALLSFFGVFLLCSVLVRRVKIAGVRG